MIIINCTFILIVFRGFFGGEGGGFLSFAFQLNFYWWSWFKFRQVYFWIHRDFLILTICPQKLPILVGLIHVKKDGGWRALGTHFFWTDILYNYTLIFKQAGFSNFSVWKKNKENINIFKRRKLSPLTTGLDFWFWGQLNCRWFVFCFCFCFGLDVWIYGYPLGLNTMQRTCVWTLTLHHNRLMCENCVILKSSLHFKYVIIKFVFADCFLHAPTYTQTALFCERSTLPMFTCCGPISSSWIDRKGLHVLSWQTQCMHLPRFFITISVFQISLQIVMYLAGTGCFW